MRNASGDSRGWVRGWAVYKERGWHPRIIGIYDTREEAEAAAQKAGRGYEVRWGSYEETQQDFISGNNFENI
ncbi:MAG TPA: hypothetical protein VND87_18620 [Stellaceae bacterium]|nr:hypothetical protein [Stellaceae bacterium]